MLYAPIGAKQVGLMGGEGKRAFTVTVSVANDGTLLPFEAIYEGKTPNLLFVQICTTLRRHDQYRNASPVLKNTNVLVKHEDLCRQNPSYFDAKRLAVSCRQHKKPCGRLTPGRFINLRSFVPGCQPITLTLLRTSYLGVVMGCTSLRRWCTTAFQALYQAIIPRVSHRRNASAYEREPSDPHRG